MSFSRALVLLGCVVGASAACASGNESAKGGEGGRSASASTGAGPGSASGTTSGFESASSNSTAESGVGGGCAFSTIEADPVPLDIFVMLDQSGSMTYSSAA